MKVHVAICALLAAVSASATNSRVLLQPLNGNAEYAISERGPHHRVWSRVMASTNSQDSSVHYRTNSYTELASGICYLQGGQWTDTRAEIELLGDGAAATNGPVKVYFAANINSTNAIDVTTPDGKRLRSRPIGLSYFDGTNAVLIGALQDSIGLLVGTNIIVYTNCFSGVDGELQYVYSPAGLAQNVILRSQMPSPESVGLSSNATLGVVTEFFDPPVPSQRAILLGPGQTNYDQILDFGWMRMGAGKAFAIGNGQSAGKALPVSKIWGSSRGRTFLIEDVPFKQVNESLRTLSTNQGASLGPRFRGHGESLMAAVENMLSKPVKTGIGKAGKIMVAQLDLRRQPGFLTDYELVPAAWTNYTFKGGSTYYISGLVQIEGDIVFEGGTVLKYGGDSPELVLTSSSVTWKTGPYRLAQFTSKNDDTTGDIISGSSGTPTQAGEFLEDLNGNLSPIRYARFSYAATALMGYSQDIWHSQFVSCSEAVEPSNYIGLHNVLISACTYLMNGSGMVQGEHVTIHSAPNLDTVLLSLTNSILTSVNLGEYTPVLDHCSLEQEAYQTVGAGAYYLSPESACRSAATTNISPQLLADLNKMTTYPPVVLSNVTVSESATIYPQAQRDTDLQDLGYHYDPLDYLVAFCAVTNATLTIQPGTAIGYLDSSAGVWLQEGSSLNCIGEPLLPNWIAHYRAVQEQAVALGDTTSASALGINAYHQSAPEPTAAFRFTKFSSANGGYGLYHLGTSAFTSLSFRDCEVWSGQNFIEGAAGTSATIQNNLFHRGGLDATVGSSTSQIGFSNNLVWNATVTFSKIIGGDLWKFHDNAFDSCSIGGIGSVSNSHNAYISCTGSLGRLSPTNSTDIVLTNFSYASGPLGNFYQLSTNLINQGSTTADLVGLYHFTSRTNLSGSLQIKETNSVVDIGWHAVAVNSSGIPIDTDGDGIPDYFEDANGNGIADDLTSWLDYNSPNALTNGNGLVVFTPLK